MFNIIGMNMNKGIYPISINNIIIYQIDIYYLCGFNILYLFIIINNIKKPNKI
jgi:hypothetical protein